MTLAILSVTDSSKGTSQTSENGTPGTGCQGHAKDQLRRQNDPEQTLHLVKRSLPAGRQQASSEDPRDSPTGTRAPLSPPGLPVAQLLSRVRPGASPGTRKERAADATGLALQVDWQEQSQVEAWGGADGGICNGHFSYFNLSLLWQFIHSSDLMKFFP